MAEKTDNIYAGSIEIPDLEKVVRALNLAISLVELDPTTKGGYRHEDLIELKKQVEDVLKGSKARNSWKELVAYWQDGTECEVVFEGFEVNQVGQIKKVQQINPGVYDYVGGGSHSSLDPFMFQEIRYKEHTWSFRIWFDRKDPSGWPLVEVA